MNSETPPMPSDQPAPEPAKGLPTLGEDGRPPLYIGTAEKLGLLPNNLSRKIAELGIMRTKGENK